MRYSSLIDLPRPGLDPLVWDSSGKLLKKHKDKILSKIQDGLERQGWLHYDQWIAKKKIIGSLTSYLYNNASDIDIHFVVDIDKFIDLEHDGSINKEEAAQQIDVFRKRFNREEKEFLDGTKHEIEYYFEVEGFIEEGHSIDTGEYDLDKDEWTIEPLTVDHDYDAEEIYAAWLPEITKTLQEFDTEVGEIRRDLREIDDIDEVIKVWPKDKKLKFQNKLEQKINEIEESIRTLVEHGQGIHDQRKQEYVDLNLGIGTLTFKYLQKYGYVYLWAKLRDLITDDDDLTKDEIEEVKEIVDEYPNKRSQMENTKMNLDNEIKIRQIMAFMEEKQPNPVYRVTTEALELTDDLGEGEVLVELIKEEGDQVTVRLHGGPPALEMEQYVVDRKHLKEAKLDETADRLFR